MSQTKDSGIDWIGDIPEHWNMISNRHLFQYDGSKVGNNYKDYSLLSLTTNGVREKDINETGGKVPTSYDSYQTVKSGQMIFCLFDLDCSAVFSGLSRFDGMITSAYDVFSCTNLINSSYADYFFQYVFSNRYYKTYSKNVRYTITGDTFASIKTPVPPYGEQEKISIFLDTKIGQSKNLIDNLNNQIDKLKEYKKALIAKCVTKGLDPNVPLKDSGIEWIGEIPNTWSTVQIGSLYYERNEHVSSLNFEPLSVTKKGILPQLETAAKSDNPNDRKLVRVNDFAINSRSDRRGSCGISQYDGSVSLINTVLVPCQINLFSNKFYEYVFHTDRFADEFYKWGHGIVDDLWTTKWQEMKKINLPFPPLNEQIKTSSYLDKKCSEIDALISSKQQQIDKLNEYQKSLIYEYVTGKKEVV